MSGQLPQFIWDLRLPMYLQQHRSGKCNGELVSVMYLSGRKLRLWSHVLLGWSDLLQWNVYQHLQQLHQLWSLRRFGCQRPLLRQWQGDQFPGWRLRLRWHLPRLLISRESRNSSPRALFGGSLACSEPLQIYTRFTRALIPHKML